MKWTKEWPKEEGYFWFYGYRHGKIFCGSKEHPVLILVEARKNAFSQFSYVGDGQFMYKSEVEEAHFQKAILPELPKLD